MERNTPSATPAGPAPGGAPLRPRRLVPTTPRPPGSSRGSSSGPSSDEHAPAVPDRAPDPAPDRALDRALELVRFLRANCEWDAAQTPESLIRHLLEESHEVADAIHGGSAETLRQELGDLLLNLAFQIVIAEERGRFDAEAVVSDLEDKMRRRHPHLYGLGDAASWDEVKLGERSEGESALDGVPDGFDPLHKAYRLGELASGVGFDWPGPEPALDKVQEEVGEVRRSLPSRAGLADELGDLLFAAVNVIRLAGHQPGVVLERANRKFAERFRRVEALAAESGRPMQDLDLEGLDALWERVKRQEDGPQ